MGSTPLGREAFTSAPISVNAIKKTNKQQRMDFPPSGDPYDVQPTIETLLQYPDDVGSTNRNANYIIFTSFKQIPAKLSPGQKDAVAAAVMDAESSAGGDEWGGSGETKNATMARVAQAKQNATDNIHKVKGLKAWADSPAGASLHMQKGYTKSGTSIALYMPPSVQAKYGMQYEDAPIGFMSEAIYSIIKEIQSGAQWDEAITQAAGTVGTGLTKMGIKMLDTVVPGAKDLIAMERGTIIAPRTEVMFQGIGKRNFTFNFTFIPKSRPETKTVDKIIKEFKRAMTPAFKIGRGVRELNFPEMFQIAYMHYENENEYINKIGRCFLEDATVSYGGEKFITFEPDSKGAPPNKITLALTFKEIEVMDQTKIMAGY